MATKLEGSPGMPVTESSLQEQARRHLWLHFSPLDGLLRGARRAHHRPRRGLLRLRRERQALPRRARGLLCVAAGRAELADAAAAQARELSYYPS